MNMGQDGIQLSETTDQTGSLFDIYPEFVEDDTRKDRKFGYKISADFLYKLYWCRLSFFRHSK
jgi:hypothetical protein